MKLSIGFNLHISLTICKILKQFPAWRYLDGRNDSAGYSIEKEKKISINL